LSDIEEKKEEDRINKEIADLQKQLDELKKIETQANTQKSVQEVNEVKENVKNPEIMDMIR
jgi:hypothetical protein